MSTIDKKVYARIHDVMISREKELSRSRDRDEQIDIIVTALHEVSDLPHSELRSIARKVVNEELKLDSSEDVRWTRYLLTSIVGIMAIYLIVQFLK